MMTPGDLDIWARTVWGEARGETFIGKQAVAWCICNRWKNKHRRETTLAGVCTEPYQFSCWNLADPNRRGILKVDLDDHNFRESMIACLTTVQPGSFDPTNGATHYHTKKAPNWAKEWPPDWTKGHAPSAEIGEHLFYAGIL